MTLLHKFMGTGSPSAPTYVDDVFSAYTYTGNSSTQTITNGIDLAGQGGLVWFKSRTPSAYGHYLFDTLRGNDKSIRTESTGAETTTATPITFNSSGVSLGNVAGWNENATSFVSFSFRKAPKFFDVVTYTGNGVAGRTIAHSLGQDVGMLVVKATSTTGSWQIWHRGLTSGNYLQFTTAAQSTANAALNFGNDSVTVDPTSSVFTVGTSSNVNTNGTTYVAYLFAHDTAADGLIQCGSFTTDGSGVATVTGLGWEPQFLLAKKTNSTGDWFMLDVSRGYALSKSQYLRANTSGTETGSVANEQNPTADGFRFVESISSTYVYLAIRRPNKPPTTGTQVYNAIARTGTSATTTVTGVGFPPDAVFAYKQTGGIERGTVDRLRGRAKYLSTAETSAEYTTTGTSNDVVSFNMDGLTLGPTDASGINAGPDTHINYFFKRAPSVFDEVCYTGTGSATTVTHNLGVAPELMIVKSRSGAVNWVVYHSANANSGGMQLNTTAAFTAATDYWNSTSPTSTVFSVGTRVDTNQSTATFVAYLFATKAGISKVFSYTGNGSSQTINCGFSAGARFILIKRTDSTGDWYVWDTVRGVVAGNDPHLSLNTTAAEVTTNDSIDPDNSGFIVNQLAATNINVTSATYIGLAFA